MAERTFGSYPQVPGMQAGGDKEEEIKRRVEEILKWDRLRGKKNTHVKRFCNSFCTFDMFNYYNVQKYFVPNIQCIHFQLFANTHVWVRKYFLKPYNFKECSWNAFGNVNKLTMTMDGECLPIQTHVSWTRTSRVMSISSIAGWVKYSRCRTIIFVFCCKYAYIWENNCPSPIAVDKIPKKMTNINPAFMMSENKQSSDVFN